LQFLFACAYVPFLAPGHEATASGFEGAGWTRGALAFADGRKPGEVLSWWAWREAAGSIVAAANEFGSFATPRAHAVFLAVICGVSVALAAFILSSVAARDSGAICLVAQRWGGRASFSKLCEHGEQVFDINRSECLVGFAKVCEHGEQVFNVHRPVGSSIFSCGRVRSEVGTHFDLLRTATRDRHAE
jgi:hypothetical protein